VILTSATLLFLVKIVKRIHNYKPVNNLVIFHSAWKGFPIPDFPAILGSFVKSAMRFYNSWL